MEIHISSTICWPSWNFFGRFSSPLYIELDVTYCAASFIDDPSGQWSAPVFLSHSIVSSILWRWRIRNSLAWCFLPLLFSSSSFFRLSSPLAVLLPPPSFLSPPPYPVHFLLLFPSILLHLQVFFSFLLHLIFSFVLLPCHELYMPTCLASSSRPVPSFASPGLELMACATLLTGLHSV